MKISICIPTWEFYGNGDEFLDDLLRTIEIQTFKDYEVIISDHSNDNFLLKVIKNFEDKFNISYFENKVNQGNSPSNVNNAIKYCSGDIIKIMFQDDFFYDDEALEKINDKFDSDGAWLVCGSNHTNDHGNSFYWDLYPKWNSNLINGVNTIGSPSCLSVRRETFDKIKFDENLKMMMDCEYFYSMNELYGNPIYLNDVLITNRVHSGQISANFMSESNHKEKIQDEINYCMKKHRL